MTVKEMEACRGDAAGLFFQIDASKKAASAGVEPLIGASV
jgi:hypothetical protein